MHNAVMSSEITITNVPDDLRAALEQRAAICGQTVEEFILSDLKRFAPPPPNDEWLRKVRERVNRYGSQVTAEEILAARDAGRERR